MLSPKGAVRFPCDRDYQVPQVATGSLVASCAEAVACSVTARQQDDPMSANSHLWDIGNNIFALL